MNIKINQDTEHSFRITTNLIQYLAKNRRSFTAAALMHSNAFAVSKVVSVC